MDFEPETSAMDRTSSESEIKEEEEEPMKEELDGTKPFINLFTETKKKEELFKEVDDKFDIKPIKDLFPDTKSESKPLLSRDFEIKQIKINFPDDTESASTQPARNINFDVMIKTYDTNEAIRIEYLADNNQDHISCNSQEQLFNNQEVFNPCGEKRNVKFKKIQVSSSKKDKKSHLADSDKQVRHTNSTQTVEKRKRCKFCLSKIPRSEFKKHVHTYHKTESLQNTNEQYRCIICSIKFAREISFKKYKHINTSENPFMCSTCNISFIQSCTLTQDKNKHITTTTEVKQSGRYICGSTVTKLKKVKLYIQKLPEKKQFAYHCMLCHAKFLTYSYFNTHIRTHTSEKPYKCIICSHAFVESSSLKLHMKTHAGEQPYKCKLCSHGFAEKNCLERHMSTHASERPYKCSICSYATSQYSSLKRHMGYHAIQRPLKCPICNFSSATDRQITKHMKCQHQKLWYKCSLCTFSATTMSMITLHLRNHHSNIATYYSIIYPRLSLKEGKETITGTKSYKWYKCSVCHFVDNKNRIRNHMLHHTKQHYFKCSICSFSAVKKGQLTVHTKNQHDITL